ADGGLEGHLRQTHFPPKSSFAIALEVRTKPLGFTSRDGAAKHVLRDSMRPFRAMQRRQPQTRMPGHATLGLFRVSIDEIQGDKETRVRINAQYRPRSSISRSAPGR